MFAGLEVDSSDWLDVEGESSTIVSNTDTDDIEDPFVALDLDSGLTSEETNLLLRIMQDSNNPLPITLLTPEDGQASGEVSQDLSIENAASSDQREGRRRSGRHNPSPHLISEMPPTYEQMSFQSSNSLLATDLQEECKTNNCNRGGESASGTNQEMIEVCMNEDGKKVTKGLQIDDEGSSVDDFDKDAQNEMPSWYKKSVKHQDDSSGDEVDGSVEVRKQFKAITVSEIKPIAL